MTIEHLQSIEEQIEHLAAFAKLFFNATGDTKVYVPSDFFTISNGQFEGNTDGYVMWKGEMFFVEAATYAQPAQTVYFAISTATDSKVYANNTPNAYRTTRSGQFSVSQPDTVADTIAAADINAHLITAVTNLARNTVGSATKPVYINNGVPTAGTHELKQSVTEQSELTDTKVTAVGNHYAPAEDSNAQLSASASGATAAWGIDVVKGVTLKRDAKGHVTGVAVTPGKIPDNPDTGATSVETTGSGNAVTSASYSASTRKLTLTKGTTFLTSHQDISGKAPNNHASTATTYGVATSSNYGHVKLGAANQNGATAANGVAAPNGHTHSQYLTSHQSRTINRGSSLSQTNGNGHLFCTVAFSGSLAAYSSERIRLQLFGNSSHAIDVIVTFYNTGSSATTSPAVKVEQAHKRSTNNAAGYTKSGNTVSLYFFAFASTQTSGTNTLYPSIELISCTSSNISVALGSFTSLAISASGSMATSI